MQSKQEILNSKLFKVPEISDLKDMLYKSATKFKNKCAFRSKDTTGKIYNVTYEKFKNDVEYLGTALAKLGYIGKSICVIGKNSYNWAVSYLASSILGTVVPLDKELHSDDIVNFINISETSLVLGDEKSLATIQNATVSFVSSPKLVNIDDSNLDDVVKFTDLLQERKSLS